MASRDPASRRSDAGDAAASTPAPSRASGLYTQALPILLLTAVGGTVAGGVLGQMGAVLEAIPALIVVTPALISLRGTVNGAVGARLGSAAHMGLLDGPAAFDEIWENVAASLTLSASVSAAAAIIGYVLTWAFGYDPGSPILLLAISVAAAVASGVILAGVTVASVLVAHRRGLDPDNVTTPILATVGDIVTLAFLFAFAAWATGGIA